LPRFLRAIGHHDRVEAPAPQRVRPLAESHPCQLNRSPKRHAKADSKCRRARSPSSALACCSREPASRCWLRGSSKQLLPRIGWIPAIQHLTKHRVSVVGALIGAQRRVIVHPGENDDFRVR
jgi:hypothetical protein